MFKLDYNITKINFYLYLYNNEIYNDEKMEYLKKILFNNKKLNLIYFLLYKYMANYYRKTVNNTANDVKLKMQMAAFTLKLSENNDKIDDLLKADKDIKKDITDNSNNIKNIKNEIDLKLSDKIDNLLSDNYYDKTEINDKTSKLNRNIVLFNTNLTNHIDKYSKEKKILMKT